MKPFHILLIIFILSVIGLWMAGPIPQDLAYHNFADGRIIWGIPNFWDVVSNLPMFFIGAYLLWFSLTTWNDRQGIVAQWLPIVLSFGMALACFGSAYYHWAPDNHTLVWDRLPMTLIFMPLLALMVDDFIGKKEGKWAFFTLIPLGIFSVFYWDYTEAIGQGDLRFYAFVQFFPMLIVPFVLWLYPKRVDYVRYIWFILGWYVVAKLAEHFDKEIYEILGFWSGHTIKHLVSAVSLYYVILLIKSWQKEMKH